MDAPYSVSLILLTLGDTPEPPAYPGRSRPFPEHHKKDQEHETFHADTIDGRVILATLGGRQLLRETPLSFISYDDINCSQEE